MENAEWYYAVNGQQVGPVAEGALRPLLSSRRVSMDDLVWQEGMKDWQPAGTVAAFAGALAPPAPGPVAGVVFAPPPPAAPPPPVSPGWAPAPNQLPYAPPVQDFYGMAIGAFVVSLVGLACFGIVLGPVAIVLSVIAMNNMKRTGINRGKGLAVAGLVIGIVDLLFFFLFIAISFLAPLRH